jgi:hemolysin III
MTATPQPARYSASERAADRTVHFAGLVLGLVGAAILLVIAACSAKPMIVVATLIYSASLVAMLVCSTLYHHSTQAYRLVMRRLDHAAIFILIAGTYTPFTTCRLHGVWAIGLTVAVWAGALGGAAVKLRGPLRSTGLSIAAYIALGWIGVVALRPILDAVDPLSLILLGAGGVIYSIGVGVYRWRSLRFHNAIWHAMVVIAASCQFVAILRGVVLA